MTIREVHKKVDNIIHLQSWHSPITKIRYISKEILYKNLIPINGKVCYIPFIIDQVKIRLYTSLQYY